MTIKGFADDKQFDVYFIKPTDGWSFTEYSTHPKWERGIKSGLEDILESLGAKNKWHCALCKKESRDAPAWAICVLDGREDLLSPASPMVCLACSNKEYMAVDASPPPHHLRVVTGQQRIADRISEAKGW
jgi:hypothetical protein